MTTFEQLGLAPPLLKALAAEGYTSPTPIQSQAIAPALAGRDVQGIAQRKPATRGACRVLVLAPTRELASQIADSFRAYGTFIGVRVTTMFGGVPKGKQARAMAGGVDVLVATPGRLIDHMQDRTVRLDLTEVLVLDEADHMLDLGFIVPIRRIVSAIPAQRQTLFFSATMPKEISGLAESMLRDPVHVAVTPAATTVERVDQSVIFTDGTAKRGILRDLLRDVATGRTLVFTRTKHGADKVVKYLEEHGVPCAAIHGNKSQPQRERALADFRDGRTRVLIATDIAARGIDVDGVTHVINFDLPNVPESYVHRIGRTARAGNDGMAISLCANDERPFLKSIEKLTRTRIPVREPNRVMPKAA